VFFCGSDEAVDAACQAGLLLGTGVLACGDGVELSRRFLQAGACVFLEGGVEAMQLLEQFPAGGELGVRGAEVGGLEGFHGSAPDRDQLKSPGQVVPVQGFPDFPGSIEGLG